MNRIFCLCLLFYSYHAHAQLLTQSPSMWLKPFETKDKKQELLNFHNRIDQSGTNRLIQKKLQGYSLILVQGGVNDLVLWIVDDSAATLSSNKFVRDNKVVPLTHRQSILSYSSSSGKNLLDKTKLELTEKNLYEVIFFEKTLGKKFLKQIHTYLAIKYGISLTKTEYVNSSGEVIWKATQNQTYSYRPTGIGRDDANGLNQLQSGNAEDSFLSIAKGSFHKLNDHNDYRLEDKSYAIWSDNDAPLHVKGKGQEHVLERRWKINFINMEDSNFTVRVNNQVFAKNADGREYFIVVQDSVGNEFEVKGKDSLGTITFGNVCFHASKNGYATFSFKTKNIVPDVLFSKSEVDKVSSADQKFLVYPNPVRPNNQFTIQLPSLKNATIKIVNEKGQLILQKNILANQKIVSMKIAFAGSYFIQIYEQEKMKTTLKLLVL